MKDRYNGFRHENQILNTVESTENPAVKAIHRGSSAKYKHEVAYSDSLAPLKEISEPQKTINNTRKVANEISSRKLKSGKNKMQGAEILYTNAQKEQKSIYQQFHNAVR
jgi:hypothetical protein